MSSILDHSAADIFTLLSPTQRVILNFVEILGEEVTDLLTHTPVQAYNIRSRVS